MTAASLSLRETLERDHRFFQSVADMLDRARLRTGPEMRGLLAGIIEILGPALAAHEGVEKAALERAPRPGKAAWEEALRVAELQHDGIAALVKDIGIIVAEPTRYRPEHLASLSFLLAKDLREHLAHEDKSLWASCPELERAAPPDALAALRRVEGQLGRL